MKITPLEIRQKQFEKKTFGGIDKDEVQAFLNSLSLAWEKMLEEQAALKARLEGADKEVGKLREVESSLYKTLKTAEDTGKNTVSQANQQAQLIVQEAKLKAETILQETKWKANKAMEQAEDYAKRSYQQMVQDVKVLERDLRSIESLKDNFLSDIKIIAQDLLEKADKANQRSANIQFKVPAPPQLDFGKPLGDEKGVQEVISKLQIPENQQTIGFVVNPVIDSDAETPAQETENQSITMSQEPEPDHIKRVERKPEPEKPEANPVKEEGSFFDRI